MFEIKIIIKYELRLGYAIDIENDGNEWQRNCEGCTAQREKIRLGIRDLFFAGCLFLHPNVQGTLRVNRQSTRQDAIASSTSTELQRDLQLTDEHLIERLEDAFPPK